MSRIDNSDQPKSCSSCIGRLRKLNGREVESPFSKQVILDFYDGALNGILRCDACGRAYTFRIVDWDDKFEKRVFALSPLPPDEFDKVIKLSSRGVQAPKWPIWAPERLPDESEHSEVDVALEESLGQAGPPVLLVGADRYLQRVFAVRVPEAKLQEEIRKSNSAFGPDATRNWFEYIGLLR